MVVEGLSFVDEREILEQAAIPRDSTRMAGIDFSTVKANVELHPFVRVAAVSQRSADEICIRVEEREPVAYLLGKGSELLFVDAEGIVLEYRFTNKVFDVPLLSGFYRKNGLDSVRLQSAVRMVNHLSRAGELLYRNISELRLESDGGYTLITTDNAIPIIFGSAENPGEAIEKLRAFWNDLSTRSVLPEVAYIDLRWQNQIVVNTRR